MEAVTLNFFSRSDDYDVWSEEHLINNKRASRFIYLKTKNGVVPFRTEMELFAELKRMLRERGIKGLSFYKNDNDSLIKLLNSETDTHSSLELKRASLQDYIEFIGSVENCPIREIKRLGILK